MKTENIKINANIKIFKKHYNTVLIILNDYILCQWLSTLS